MTRTLSLAAILVLTLVTAGCHASYPSAPTDAAPVAFQLFFTRATGLSLVGASHQFLAYVLNSDGAFEDVTRETEWSSSDPLILRPSASRGFFSALAPGAAEVVARWRGFTSSTWIVVVRPGLVAFPFLGITLAEPLTVGERAQSVATLRHSATASEVVTDRATWTSSDPGVVTVDRGAVTAVAPGTAYITAAYDGLTATYGLSVRPRR
jgi:trimeric autotransporter adhesin